jgi:sugar lactone lactonase YvrE
MNSSNFNRVLDLCAAAALLAGCGGPQPPIGAPGAMPQNRAIVTQVDRSGSWILLGVRNKDPRTTYKISGPLLYATNQLNSTNWDGVTVYRADAKDPAPLAKISDHLNSPFGECIDGQGTLYVTNAPASAGWVSEYPLGKTTPSGIITDGIGSPGWCAIDAKGNLWVGNAGANVTEYLKGSKKPHAVITKGLASPAGIAIDRSGNLYVANHLTEYSGNVVVYAPGKKSPSRTITNGVTFPEGLVVDSKGTLYVVNIFQNNVEEYRSGQDDPFQTITEAMDHPTDVTVDKKGVLYVSNIGNSTVVEFAPGSLKRLKRQISNGLYEPYGIAYYPALLP